MVVKGWVWSLKQKGRGQVDMLAAGVGIIGSSTLRWDSAISIFENS